MNKFQVEIGDGERRASGIILAGVVVFKVLLILLVVPWLSETYQSLYQIDSFPDNYDKIAMNLIEGNGYRNYPEASETMLRLPGFVFVLAGIFFLFGKSLFAVQCFNLVCSFIAALIIRATGRRFLRLTWQADLAAMLYLLYPGTVLSESRAGVECIFALLVIGFIYLFYRALESNRIVDYAYAGIVLALSAFIKSTTLVMPVFLPVLLLFYKFRSLGLLHVIKSSVCMVLPMLIIMSPWAMRNYSLTGELVVTQTNLGTTAYQGLAVNDEVFTNRDHASVIGDATLRLNAIATELDLDLVRYDFFQHFGSAKDEVVFDRYLASIVKQRYLDSPVLLIENVGLNFLRYWFQGRTWNSTLLNTLLVAPCLVLVGVGIYRGVKFKLPIVPAMYFSAIFIAGHLPILATARYHVTIIPVLVLFAAMAFLPKQVSRTVNGND